jgi:6-phosphogluconolactonase
VLDSPHSLAVEAANEWVRLAVRATEENARFSLALAGGSTPKRLYALLASESDGGFRSQTPWDRMDFFWGDERHVPPAHPESNYRMAYETLLSKVPVAPQQIHRIRSENPDALQAARDYELTLNEHFGLKPGLWPRFKLVLLGLGSDGHTASLFPGTSVLDESKCLVAAPWVERFKSYRVTLTAPVLNQAENVIFLVSGEDKAEAVRAVLQGDFRPQVFPAQLVQPASGELLWLVDRGAASLLS